MEKRNESGTENGTKPEQIGRFRGVRRLKPRLDRPKPFGVEWRADGTPKTEWFGSEAEREKRYAALVREHKRGTLNHVVDRRDAAEWNAFKAAIGDTDWREVVAGWIAHNNSQLGSLLGSTLTVGEACSQFLAAEEKRFATGRLAADTMRHKRQKIRAFSDAFGVNLLSRVSPTEIEQWIASDLGHEVGDTFDCWVGHIRTLYSKFADEVPKNPCDKIESRGGAIEHVNILSVRDSAKLFAYAMRSRRAAIGRLALEAFAGLRFGSAMRLERNDINFEDRGILLPAHKLKTGMVDGRRHYIDELPENLWSWLELATPDCWTLTNSEWMHLKTDTFLEAGVPHPRNCLRHSFATYHVAAFKNPGRTATILCHTSQEKLWQHYNGNATAAFGRQYFAISPKTCEQMAKLDIEQTMPSLPPVRSPADSAARRTSTVAAKAGST